MVDSFRAHHPFNHLAASTDSLSMFYFVSRLHTLTRYACNPVDVLMLVPPWLLRPLCAQRCHHRKQVLGGPVHFRPEPVTSTVQNEIIRQTSICPGILGLPGHRSDSASGRAATSALIEDEQHTLDWVLEL